MSIYRIPLYQRITQVGNSPWAEKCLHIDNVGLFITYPPGREDLLTVENIRRHLIGRSRTWCFVEADSPEKAVETFHNEWEGAKIGGETKESKALWIANEQYNEPIEEYPYCESLHKNTKAQFICGEEDNEGQGIGGMCVLEGYDSFEGCVIDAYKGLVSVLEDAKRLPIKTIEGGYRIIRVEDVMKEAQKFSRAKKVVVGQYRSDYKEIKSNLKLINNNLKVATRG